MRDASHSSLDMLKCLRQDLLSIQMSGESNSMPSNSLEFNFDKKVHFRPPISTNSNRNEHIRESSINESSTKSPSQQYLPSKPVQNTTISSSRENLRPVDTRSNRIDRQSNNYSIMEDDDDDDDDDDEEEEEEDSSISSGGKVSDSSNSSIQQRHSTSAAPIPLQPPPPRRGAQEEVSSMIRELRALVVQLKENSLSLTPTATTFKEKTQLYLLFFNFHFSEGFFLGTF